MIKELISALRGSNKPRKDVVTRLVVNGDVYTDSDEVKVQQNDRTSTIEIDGSQVHFNSPLSHQDGFDHTVNGMRIRISGHTVVIA